MKRDRALLGSWRWLLIPASLLSGGCGNALNCAILGDNVKGRVTFGSSVNVVAGSAVIVEWSMDSFSSVSGRSTQRNIHGLLSVPYSTCIDSGVDVQFRAYQDLNENTLLDGGEAYGRYDQTGSGDASYLSKQVPASSASSDWRVLEGIDIAIDTP